MFHPIWGVMARPLSYPRTAVAAPRASEKTCWDERMAGLKMQGWWRVRRGVGVEWRMEEEACF